MESRSIPVANRGASRELGPSRIDRPDRDKDRDKLAMIYRRKRRRWHVNWALKEWEWWRRHQDMLDLQSSDEEEDESSSSSDGDMGSDDVSDSGSEGDVRVFVFEGNPKAQHASPFSPLGRERAASAESEKKAAAAAAAAAAADTDDSDSDFDDGPPKKAAAAAAMDEDDSEDDFADGPPTKAGAAMDADDSDDDFADAPAPKSNSQTAALLGAFPDNADDESDDDSDDEDWEDDEDAPESPETTWLLDVAEPFEAAFPSGAARRKVCLAYSESMTRHHERSTDHPERPERITMAHAELERSGLLDHCETLAPRRATSSELRRVHEKGYVQATLALRAKCDAALRSGDDEALPELREALGELAKRQNSVYLNEHSVDCALLSCGGTVDAVLKVVEGAYDHGCALTRPPGHHAECHCMMGFCLYANVGVAVAAALNHADKPVRRVLVLDWDVHHGNGTQNMFYDDPRVLFCSLHRYDRGTFYPPGEAGGPHMVGSGKGKGFNVNVGWDGGGAGDADYAAAFDNLLVPLFQLYNPELVVVSAGFDSARGDPLGGCDLTPRGYARLLGKLLDLAPQRGVALCLEGGYNCISVARSYAACVAGLQGAARPDDADLPRPSLRALKAVAKTADHVLPFWPKLKKHVKKCKKAYAKAHKRHLAKQQHAPKPQFGPGHGWAF